MEGSPDSVLVDVAGETVAITAEDRDTLLEELSFVPGSKKVREKFEAAGVGGPVQLDPEERALLGTTLETVWEHIDPPDGIARLLAELRRTDEGGHAASPAE